VAPGPSAGAYYQAAAASGMQTYHQVPAALLCLDENDSEEEQHWQEDSQEMSCEQ
jgi:hypothetical protein